MKKQLSAVGLALAGILLADVSASAASLVTTTTYGGHSYELWSAPGISWGSAEANALGGGGYLAVLNSAPETAAVYGAFIGNGFFQPFASQEVQAYIGGYTTDPGFSTTNPNNWAWVTGESWNSFSASNFAGGEPNGDSAGLAINRYGTSNWNDEGGFVGGYIVEKGRVVPDAGSTLGFLMGAFAMLGAFGRKSRKA